MRLRLNMPLAEPTEVAHDVVEDGAVTAAEMGALLDAVGTYQRQFSTSLYGFVAAFYRTNDAILDAEARTRVEEWLVVRPGRVSLSFRDEVLGAVFPRMAVYSRAGGRDWATGDVMQLSALALDAVVFVNRTRDGRRVLAEIRHVDHYDPDTGQVVTDVWFEPGPDGLAVPSRNSPIPVRLLDELVAHGYDPALHTKGTW